MSALADLFSLLNRIDALIKKMDDLISVISGKPQRELRLLSLFHK